MQMGEHTDVPHLYTHIGTRLKAMREKARLTLFDAAIALHIYPQNLSRYESGRRRPSIEMLLRICQQYGCQIQDLVSGFVLGEASKHIIKR